MNIIKLFILDDHQMLLDGLKALLVNESRYSIIGEANNGTLALELISENLPDIVITDINMPEMDGIQFTKLLLEKHPKVKVIALSMFGEKSTISEMLEAGVSGYILKNTGKQELIDALEKVASGGKFLSDEVLVEMMKAITENEERKEEETKAHLTDREKEIIKLIAKEFNNAKIGEMLFISERTVETHRKNIFRKTGTKTVVGLIKYAIENKLID